MEKPVTNGENKKSSEHERNELMGRRRNPDLPYLNCVKTSDGYNLEMNTASDYGRAELMAALGTIDGAIVRGLLSQVINMTDYSGNPDEDALNFLVAYVKSGKPRGPTEAMLLLQTGMTHWLATLIPRRILGSTDPREQETYQRLYSKFANTFVSQVETLERLRCGGGQKLFLSHVSVNEGGQAVVGNISHAPRQVLPSRPDLPAAAITDARAAPMPIVNEAQRHIPTARVKVRSGKRK